MRLFLSPNTPFKYVEKVKLYTEGCINHYRSIGDRSDFVELTEEYVQLIGNKPCQIVDDRPTLDELHDELLKELCNLETRISEFKLGGYDG